MPPGVTLRERRIGLHLHPTGAGGSDVGSSWPLVLVLGSLGVGPLLVWAGGAPTSRVTRRGIALLLLGLGAIMVPHTWEHAGIAIVPAALVGLAMSYQIHRASHVGTATTVVSVGLLSVHMVLDGSALAMHDESTMPWMIALHRLPVGITIMAIAAERYATERAKVVGTGVVFGLSVLTAA
ncbi:MAG: hypothetical protein AAF211_30440, partial [Myxococcota bacterium]